MARGSAGLPAGFVPLSPYTKPKQKPKGEEEYRKDKRSGPLRTKGAQEDDVLEEDEGEGRGRQETRAKVDRWGDGRTKTEVFISNTISVERLAVVLGVRLRESSFSRSLFVLGEEADLYVLRCNEQVDFRW